MQSSTRPTEQPDQRQLCLFAGLDSLMVEPQQPYKIPHAKPLRMPAVVQLALTLVERRAFKAPPVAAEDENDDDPLVTAPIVHAWVRAADCPPPAICAPRSVFEMFGAQVIDEAMGGFIEDEPAPPKAIQDTVHLRVTQDGGITRVVRMHHTDTDEWKEREAARRARQRPPKPPKQSFELGRVGRKKANA